MNKDKVLLAVGEYLDRKNHCSFPEGRDRLRIVMRRPLIKERQWWPTENLVCCKSFLRDRRKYIRHCNTLEHVSALFGVGTSEVRKRLKD